MPEILGNQVSANATMIKPIHNDKIDDFITKNLQDASRQLGNAADLVAQRAQRRATDKMKLATTEADIAIEKFTAFDSDDYMDKMQAEAFQKWDEAYSSMSLTERKKFDEANPSARSIFELKIKEAVEKKTVSHEAEEQKVYNDQLAWQIVMGENGKARTPNDVKAMVMYQNDIIRNNPVYQAHPEIAEQLQRDLERKAVGGALDMALLDGRYDDVESMVADKELGKFFSPTERLTYVKSAQAQRAAEQKAAKEQGYGSAGVKQASDRFKQFLNDTIVTNPDVDQQEIIHEWVGALSQLNAGVAPGDVMWGNFSGFEPQFAELIKGMSPTEIMEATNKAVKDITNSNPEYKRAQANAFGAANNAIIGILARQQGKEDDISKVKTDAEIDVSKLNDEDMESLYAINENMSRYGLGLSDEQQKLADKVARTVGAKDFYTDMVTNGGVHGFNTDVQAAGLGNWAFGSEHYMTGQIPMAQAYAAISGGDKDSDDFFALAGGPGQIQDIGVESSTWYKLITARESNEKKALNKLGLLSPDSTGPGAYDVEKRMMSDIMIENFAKGLGRTEMPKRGTLDHALMVAAVYPEYVNGIKKSDGTPTQFAKEMGAGYGLPNTARERYWALRNAYGQQKLVRDEKIDNDRTALAKDTMTNRLIADSFAMAGLKPTAEQTEKMTNFVRGSYGGWMQRKGFRALTKESEKTIIKPGMTAGSKLLK